MRRTAKCYHKPENSSDVWKGESKRDSQRGDHVGRREINKTIAMSGRDAKTLPPVTQKQDAKQFFFLLVIHSVKAKYF